MKIIYRATSGSDYIHDLDKPVKKIVIGAYSGSVKVAHDTNLLSDFMRQANAECCVANNPIFLQWLS